MEITQSTAAPGAHTLNIGPSAEEMEICDSCHIPKGMHLHTTFGDRFPGFEGTEYRICTAKLPQYTKPVSGKKAGGK